MVAINNLQRKLLRDMGSSKAQFGAVAAVIAIGISAFVGVYASYQNLHVSYQYTYDVLSMGDYFITVDYLPERAVREMDDIPGVRAAGQIVGNVKLDLETESGDRVEGKIVSLPSDTRPLVSNVKLESGTYFSPGDKREVLLPPLFAEYHELAPGDSLVIEHGASKTSYTVMGIAIHPEYLWVSKSAEEPIATAKTFGVIFMPQQRAEDIFGMQGMVNQIGLAFDDSVVVDEAIVQVKDILTRYGIKNVTSKDDMVSIGARKIDIVQGVRTAYMVPREDQISYELLKADLDGLQQMSFLFPVLFLSMAGLAIYILLGRLVESQRVQIGLMRALGYTKGQVLGHYVDFALVMGILGSISGALLGYAMASALTTYYAGFLRLPFIEVVPQWNVIAVGVGVGTVVPVLASIVPCWASSRMQPAEAMRPPAPPAGHRTFIEILLPFIPRLHSTFKLPLRNMFRHPRRTLFMATGVMSATALIIVSLSMLDMVQDMTGTLFDKTQHYDARVILQGTGSESTATYIAHLEGVEAAEALLDQPYRVKRGEISQSTSIRGIEPNSKMYSLITPDGGITTVSEAGIVLPTFISDKLGVNVGDTVYLEPLVGTVGETEIVVSGLINEPMGGRPYMPLNEAQKLFNLPGAATSVFVQFYGQPSPELLQRIYDLPEVASIEQVSALKDYMDESMGAMYAMVGVMLALSFGLGLAIVFNGVTVNVLERRREIAIMRAIGMSDRQLGSIITMENLGTAMIGILIGLPLGYQLANYIMEAQSSTMENMSFSAVIYPRSYVIAAVCSIIIMLLSQMPAIKRMTTMSLPTVTKDWSE
ncbi:MAG: FtsX-like permease family protein [Dehalococcoidia bacterium]|nr:FtsX-like permease family protein [Dehalococcoidia bacterium]